MDRRNRAATPTRIVQVISKASWMGPPEGTKASNAMAVPQLFLGT